MPIAPQEFYLPFLKKEKVAKDTYAFYFDRSFRPFEFLPGQHVRVTLPIEHPDARGNSRLFSIASSPLEKKFSLIVTKIIQSSFKQALLQLIPGQKVHFLGPLGMFYLKEEIHSSHVFLAGGIGITPFLSMIPYAVEKKLTITIVLLASFSTMNDIIFYDRLTALARNNPYIKIVYALTHPKESESWSGEIGRISKENIKKHVPEYEKALYYIVGPPAMVTAMIEIVKNMEIPKEQILRESFVGY